MSTSMKMKKRKRDNGKPFEAKAEEVKKKTLQNPSKKKKKKKIVSEQVAGGSYVVQGYHLVPLRLAGTEDRHQYLYIRQHRSGGAPEEDEEGGQEEGRTLFVTNLGGGADDADTEGSLLRLFGRCGAVESVSLKSLRRVISAPNHQGQQQQQQLLQQRPAHHGGRGPWLEVSQADDEADSRPLVFAHVTFESPEGLRSALEYDWRSAAVCVVDVGAPVGEAGEHAKRGVPKWLEEYYQARPDPQRVLAEVDSFMADFDRKQRLAEQQEEAALGKPDADGFITVRRKGRKKVADGNIPVASAKAGPALAIKAQKQESDKVLLDFYRFQRRENRRKQLADLRLRFEEDKKKIAKLRSQRKFKPF